MSGDPRLSRVSGEAAESRSKFLRKKSIETKSKSVGKGRGGGIDLNLFNSYINVKDQVVNLFFRVKHLNLKDFFRSFNFN